MLQPIIPSIDVSALGIRFEFLPLCKTLLDLINAKDMTEDQADIEMQTVTRKARTEGLAVLDTGFKNITRLSDGSVIFLDAGCVKRMRQQPLASDGNFPFVRFGCPDGEQDEHMQALGLKYGFVNGIAYSDILERFEAFDVNLRNSVPVHVVNNAAYQANLIQQKFG